MLVTASSDIVSVMIASEIAASIQGGKHASKPVLVAIEGFGGSGKTTFANKLSSSLGNAYVVNIDDFIVKDKLAEPSWDMGAFDLERLERQVLIPATTQQPISYQELLWETNSLSEPKHVPEVDYLIVEGITSYHPSIAAYYDYKIWVDTPIDIAKARGRARDAGNENEEEWDMWAEMDLTYQQKYHPESLADFTVENS